MIYSFTFSKAIRSIFIITLFAGFISCGSDQERRGEDDSYAWVEETMARLSLEKKVAQLICTDITGEYIPEDDPRFQSWIRLAHEYGVGGFVIYGGTPRNLALLLNRLQQEADIPILMSADFEGGPGQQVYGAGEFPSNMGFAATRDEDLMYRATKIMAKEGRAMGIHLTYTPVTDMSLYPENPQESVRSFGADLDLMGRLLKAYVKGFKEEGMLTTSKHFPGRGDMRLWPAHPGFTYLDKTAESYESNELKAFQAAVDAGVDFMMTEHVAVPSMSSSDLPASVDSTLVKKIVRERLGFKGIVTSDDLWYDHVIARFGQEEVAIKALKAGHDIVLKPKDPVATIQAIVEAVNQGRISEEQINNSVQKLLYKKAQLGLHLNRFTNADSVSKIVGTVAHQKVVQEVADKSVTLLKNEGVFPLTGFDPGKTLHITIQKEDEQPMVKGLTQKMTNAFNGINTYSLKPGLDQSYYSAASKAASQAEWVIFSLFVQRERHGDPSPLSQADLALIRQVILSKPGKVIVMSFGNPHLIRKIGDSPAFLLGYGEGGWYGNQPAYFDSFIRILKGELRPSGKLPLTISDAYPIGFGLTY